MKVPASWTKQEEILSLNVKCQDFKRAVALLNSVADIAESLNHHPDVGIKNYNEVVVATTTHDENKLTAKDYELAQAISDLIRYQSKKEQIEARGRQ